MARSKLQQTAATMKLKLANNNKGSLLFDAAELRDFCHVCERLGVVFQVVASVFDPLASLFQLPSLLYQLRDRHPDVLLDAVHPERRFVCARVEDVVEGRRDTQQPRGDVRLQKIRHVLFALQLKRSRQNSNKSATRITLFGAHHCENGGISFLSL